eukprot:CAMPEP_0180062026 /NCGR_PEP_ID=MMETSP0985-20121206/6897_1 /TAXON_ID=483367 /ORGANISM="non described non described, Strain CCMP 2436" /LENGTH=146 /DNA_ID=CAMNT_0021992171 /DNA_START=232 /DNA_END=669 /DNA_ORIENTATION=-
MPLRGGGATPLRQQLARARAQQCGRPDGPRRGELPLGIAVAGPGRRQLVAGTAALSACAAAGHGPARPGSYWVGSEWRARRSPMCSAGGGSGAWRKDASVGAWRKDVSVGASGGREAPGAAARASGGGGRVRHGRSVLGVDPPPHT